MSDDDTQASQPRHDFDDLVDELGGETSFDWDEGDVEPDDEEQTRPVVSFRIGSDLFALPSTDVREIVGSTEITDLPGAPAHIEGITVVRRQVVGLLSLGTFLGLDATASAPMPDEQGDDDAQISTERTLIVETVHYTVGLRVDEVTGLSEWPESCLDPSTLPDNIHQTTDRYARGAREYGDTLCVFLDLESLLDDAAIQ